MKKLAETPRFGIKDMVKKKENTTRKSRRHTRTTFTPPTHEETFLLKRQKERRKQQKTRKLQSPNNDSEKVSHYWNQARGNNKSQLDLTRETKQNKPREGRLEASLLRKNRLTKGSLSKGFSLWEREPVTPYILKEIECKNINLNNFSLPFHMYNDSIVLLCERSPKS